VNSSGFAEANFTLQIFVPILGTKIGVRLVTEGSGRTKHTFYVRTLRIYPCYFVLKSRHPENHVNYPAASLSTSWPKPRLQTLFECIKVNVFDVRHDFSRRVEVAKLQC